MNTFFRTCVFLSVGLILFNLGFTFVIALDVYNAGLAPVSSNVTSPVAGDQGLMNVLFGGLTGGLSIAGIMGMIIVSGAALSLYFKSLLPVAIGAFSSVFWGSYMTTFTIFNSFQLPAEFLALITVGVGFIFVAAVIGMASGSG